MLLPARASAPGPMPPAGVSLSRRAGRDAAKRELWPGLPICWPTPMLPAGASEPPKAPTPGHADRQKADGRRAVYPYHHRMADKDGQWLTTRTSARPSLIQFLRATMALSVGATVPKN